jgi:hypothetical protein
MPYEASGNGMILDFRERQLHDEPLSCGTQPAYIRLINRRFAACFAVSALHKQGFNLIKTKTTVNLTGQYISGHSDGSSCQCDEFLFI